MGKKGSWISSIKRLFTSKSDPLNEAHKKGRRGRFKHGSFFPLCRREPSSIEQILGEIDQHNLFVPTAPQPHPQPQQQQPQPPQPQQQPQPQPQRQKQPQSQPQPQPQSQSQSEQAQQKPQPSSGRPVSPPPQRLNSPPTTAHQQPKISHIPESSLQQRHLSATRIQAVYRGYMVRRNTRSLTGLVRLQSVVTSKNVKRQTVNAMKQMQLLVRVQTQIRSRRIQMLENQALKPQPNKNSSHKQSDEEDEHWDDSVITKEERDARLQRKADAAIKRERAMAYAHSHQLRKDTPSSAHKTSGYPLWWKWVEQQLPYHTTTTTPTQKKHQTPWRLTTHKQLDTTPNTPTSSRSTNRWIKAASLYSMKDDNDSLRSCPPFSVPNYMSPTASARAKARPSSNPKERCATPTTPCSESSKRRFSSPFTPRSNRSIGDMSIKNSSVGRKPFNRFV